MYDIDLCAVSDYGTQLPKKHIAVAKHDISISMSDGHDKQHGIHVTVNVLTSSADEEAYR